MYDFVDDALEMDDPALDGLGEYSVGEREGVLAFG